MLHVVLALLFELDELVGVGGSAEEAVLEAVAGVGEC